MEPARCTYLLPIRRTSASRAEIEDFARYFQKLQAAGCDVLVVDGSPGPVFRAHHGTWGEICTHIPVDPQYPYLNGKVNGIHTGIAFGTHESVILADDDIRYQPEDVGTMCELLERFELVRPQNYLSPLPWWGRLEAARMLINRGVLRTGDYPGTCGLRRSAMLRVGQYDGDVLFDNEELVRHFILQGARVGHANDFFVLKRPPSFAKWREQRPRQAYEDFVMRSKTLAFMAVVPLALAVAFGWGIHALFAYSAAIAAVAMALSARGRRGAARRFVSASVVLHAPFWVLERAVSVYWALYWRMRYGGYPFGDKLLRKGTGTAWIAGGRLASQSVMHSTTASSRLHEPR